MTSIRRIAATRLPTQYGTFSLIAYGSATGKEHLALTVGKLEGPTPALVRLHSECLTGDIFRSARCDCGEQLEQSLIRLQNEGRGALLYLRQEGRGIGLINKIRAYTLQDQGLDTVEANRALGLPDDMRDYSEAAAMLRDLGLSQVRLLTNNPAKIEGLTSYGIMVAERVPLQIEPNPTNTHYLSTKRQRMGHLLTDLHALSVPGAGPAD